MEKEIKLEEKFCILADLLVEIQKIAIHKLMNHEKDVKDPIDLIYDSLRIIRQYGEDFFSEQSKEH